MNILVLLLAQAAAPAMPAPVAAAPSPAPWEVKTRAAGDIVSTSAAVTAKDGSRLVVKCDKGVDSVVSVQFFGRDLQTAGDDGNFTGKTVALRFDNGAANEAEWEFRASAAFISNDAVVTSLTLQLAKAKQIRVETTNAGNFGVAAVFDGPASDAPIRQVLGACGYVLGQVPVIKPVTPK